MIILGISDSHESHACLIIDGQLIAAIAEERLSRLKAEMGYPKRAIEAVLEICNVKPSEIDIVAFAGNSGFIFQAVGNYKAVFTVKDYIDQNYKYWKPKLCEGKELTLLDDFNMFKHLNSDLENNHYYPFMNKFNNSNQKDWNTIGQKIRRDTVINHIGISQEKVKFYRHEDCHKAWGIYSFQGERSNSLVLTLEGGGDDSSATLSTSDLSGNFLEHWKSNEVMVGRLYRYITLLLGMKPDMHEYKVMGLAPYGNEYHGRKSYEFFKKINIVDKEKIINTKAIKDLYFSSRDALEGERFDGIAWGLQTYLEDLLQEWVINSINKFKLENVIFSGGVAQNIKACKKLLELPCVKSFWSGPISGDGSLALGAAFLGCKENDTFEIKKVNTIYLGKEYSEEKVKKEILDKRVLEKGFQVKEKISNKQIASWLSEGKVISRFAGKMEFGQRALGNRSIIADPRYLSTIDHINRKIKRRDFWMPFTPSMMESEAKKILNNPKDIYSPFMTMAFDIKNKYENKLQAVIHPTDKSIRPQMLRKEDNPDYYGILEEFKKKTDLGVLLNTSFNLHGEPIVESPEDAINTFENSELDVLLFKDIALIR